MTLPLDLLSRCPPVHFTQALPPRPTRAQPSPLPRALPRQIAKQGGYIPAAPPTTASTLPSTSASMRSSSDSKKVGNRDQIRFIYCSDKLSLEAGPLAVGGEVGGEVGDVWGQSRRRGKGSGSWR